nr:methyltransferase domain-containing protein [Sphaerisporangium rubeum]
MLTPRGLRALADAERAVAEGADAVAAAVTLRRTYPAGLTGAALTQARLRSRATAKFGADAGVMYFTPDGLEQATRAEVAAHRAGRFGPGDRVADACCGIGGDLLALARAGCRVDAVDRDPLTVEVARANAAALGLSALVTVTVGDAEAVEPERHDALFADPARRTTGRRVFDPMSYSPPWPDVLALAARARGACLKVAPGVPYDVLPADAETEWVSWRGEVKEAAVWTGVLATPGVHRRATMLSSRPPGLSSERPGLSSERPGLSSERPGPSSERPGPSSERPGPSSERPGPSSERPGPSSEPPKPSSEQPGPPAAAPAPSTSSTSSTPPAPPSALSLTPDSALGDPPVGPVGRYLYEPDGAAIRAHLVAEVAASVEGRLLDARIAYITGDGPAVTPWASRYEVLETLPFSLKRLRAALRARDIGTVTLKKRGSALDIERLRKDLRLSGKNSGVVALTRIGDHPYALICDPA